MYYTVCVYLCMGVAWEKDVNVASTAFCRQVSEMWFFPDSRKEVWTVITKECWNGMVKFNSLHAYWRAVNKQSFQDTVMFD